MTTQNPASPVNSLNSVDDAVAEALSALVDAECADDEQRNTLQHLLNNEECAELWSRYHAVGELVRGSAVASAGFAGSVMSAVAGVEQDAAEPGAQIANGRTDRPNVVPLNTRRDQAGEAGRPAATQPARRRTGLAIAASVALAGVVGVLAVGTLGDSGTPESAQVADYQVVRDTGPATNLAARQANPNLQPASASPQTMRYSQVDPAAARQLSGYLMNHNRSRVTGSVQGTLGYARVATYQPNQAGVAGEPAQAPAQTSGQLPEPIAADAGAR